MLWVHYYDPHVDYRPPARLLAGQQGPHAAYDAEIAYVDEQLGRLLAALPAGAVVAVVGDHGEMLGDHSEATHGVLLHTGAQRVPLLLASPSVPAGQVVEPLVRTVDLLPTLLALAGAPVAAPTAVESDLDGADLLPLLTGPAAGKNGGDRTAPPSLPASSGASGSEGAKEAEPRISYTKSFQPLFAYR